MSLAVQVLDNSTDETTEIAAKNVAELKAAGLGIELITVLIELGSKPEPWRTG